MARKSLTLKDLLLGLGELSSLLDALEVGEVRDPRLRDEARVLLLCSANFLRSKFRAVLSIVSETKLGLVKEITGCWSW